MKCNKCNEKVYGKIVYLDNIPLCEECFEKYFKRCGKCHRYFKPKKFLGLCIEHTCSICNVIKSHYYKPKWKRFGVDKEVIGVELEINSINRDGYYFNEFIKECNKINKNNFFIFKRDGSIGDEGVEIVSQPASYYFHLRNAKWDKIFNLINKYEMTKNKNCGLHFHVNKEIFSSRELFLLDLFINDSKVVQMLENIGGRKLNHYCQRIRKNYDQWGLATLNRYSILNLENSNTIEFRFCKSTNDINEFYLRIMFIYSLILFFNFKMFNKSLKEKAICIKDYNKFFSTINKWDIVARKGKLLKLYISFLNNIECFNKLAEVIDQNKK